MDGYEQLRTYYLLKLVEHNISNNVIFHLVQTTKSSAHIRKSFQEILVDTTKQMNMERLHRFYPERNEACKSTSTAHIKNAVRKRSKHHIEHNFKQ